MKKVIALIALVATFSVGTSAFAAGPDVANCAKMDKGQCVSMCAQNMNHGVSQCATSPSCPMTAGCQQ